MSSLRFRPAHRAFAFSWKALLAPLRFVFARLAGRDQRSPGDLPAPCWQAAQPLGVVSAVHFVADLTLGLGEVVFDYLKEV